MHIMCLCSVLQIALPSLHAHHGTHVPTTLTCTLEHHVCTHTGKQTSTKIIYVSTKDSTRTMPETCTCACTSSADSGAWKPYDLSFYFCPEHNFFLMFVRIFQAVVLSLGDEVSEPGAIIGAELLLATLECCGVDNARCAVFDGKGIVA